MGLLEDAGSLLQRRDDLPYFLSEELFIYEDILQADLKDMIAMPTQSSSASSSFVCNNSDLQRLHYLKTSVCGEAPNLLKHFQVTENNYIEAWDTLKRRYGNKSLIVNSLLKRIILQKRINTKSASQIKSLLDTTSECIHTHSLQNLNICTDSWNSLIIFLVVQKMDPESNKDWEEIAYNDDLEELPTWADLQKFLQNTFRTLEMISRSSNIQERAIKEKTFYITIEDTIYVVCKENHYLCHYKEFSQMQPTERSDHAKNYKLCYNYNCLVPGHSVKCRVQMSCRVCYKRRHHTLLHISCKSDTSAPSSNFQPIASALSNVEEQEVLPVFTMVTSQSYNTRQVLLAIAFVSVRSKKDRTIIPRALIDPGSRALFISERATQILKLTSEPAKRVESTRTSIIHVVKLSITSKYESNYNLPYEAFAIFKQLTTKIPTKAITVTSWQYTEEIQLADPSHFTPGSIDLLIGVKEYSEKILPDVIKGPPGSLTAQNTKLGWILYGDIHSSTDIQDFSFVVMQHRVDVDEVLKSLWELGVNCRSKYTKEKLCEDIYERNYTRNIEGRYIVKLPFKTQNPKSPDGNTKERALHRFCLLKKRFDRMSGLREVYTKMIEEYKELKHTEEVPVEEIHTKICIYIPYLAVIREGKKFSNTHVIFDAPATGSNRVSFNDKQLMLGALLQGDILTWRNNPRIPVQDYRLLTPCPLLTLLSRFLRSLQLMIVISFQLAAKILKIFTLKMCYPVLIQLMKPYIQVESSKNVTTTRWIKTEKVVIP